MATPDLFPRNLRAKQMKARIDRRLADVESLILESVKTDTPVLAESAEHLITAGGKRFRPVMSLVAAEFGDPETNEVLHAAAAVELTHVATLHHDDVMDNAPLRRGKPSVNAQWGNQVAIRSGDFLLARAARLVAGLGNEAIRAHQGVLNRLVMGQAMELAGPEADKDPLQHHLEVISHKTGSLIALAGRMGALLSGAPEHVVSLLDAFGERIGLAFQLTDDIMDIAGEDDTSGKAPGTDLRHRVSTLPVLLLQARPPNPECPADTRLRSLLATPLDGERLEEALRLMRSHPVLPEARTRARQEADQARQYLRQLPQCAARTALEHLCRSATDRLV